MKKVFIQSFGCRASQADGAAIEGALEDRGFISVKNAAAADLVVVNTCTVTHGADVGMLALTSSAIFSAALLASAPVVIRVVRIDPAAMLRAE